MAKIGMTLLVLLFCLNMGHANDFLERGAFEKAKMEAGEQGKLLFVSFYAPWCSPCKWMDENTYKDTEVLALLQNRFVTLHVNIDEMEGFELKSRFDIRFLPTVLIFDKEGVMIERREETLGIKKMKALLNTVMEKNVDQPIVHKVNTSPSSAFTSAGAANFNQEVKTQVKQETDAFYVQLGAFSMEANAQKQVQQLSTLLARQLDVKKDENAGKTIFRVLTSSFSSREEAEKYKAEITTTHNVKAVVL